MSTWEISYAHPTAVKVIMGMVENTDSHQRVYARLMTNVSRGLTV